MTVLTSNLNNINNIDLNHFYYRDVFKGITHPKRFKSHLTDADRGLSMRVI
jgi:hypothetical protein